MSYLSRKKLVATVSCIAACGILLSATSRRADAIDPAKGVIRTFAVSSNSPETLPDFLSERSVGVLVPHVKVINPVLMRFGDDNCDDRFDNTVWEGRNAMHITKGGPEIVAPVKWLLTPETPEPPPTGAFTLSGPDSPLILSVELFYYEWDPFYSYGYRLRCSSGGDGCFFVVTAVFSR